MHILARNLLRYFSYTLRFYSERLPIRIQHGFKLRCAILCELKALLARISVDQPSLIVVELEFRHCGSHGPERRQFKYIFSATISIAAN